MHLFSPLLHLNVFMAEGRPTWPGKQFAMMCKVVTFSNKSGCSIIPPVLMALSGIWCAVVSIQSPTSAGGEHTLPKWEMVQVWSSLQNSSLCQDSLQKQFAVTEKRHCQQAGLLSVMPVRFRSVARFVLSENQSNWFLSTSVEISGTMCNLV